MALRLGYFRVSKEDESLQDLDIQVEAVKEKFNLGDELTVFKERGSAYKLENIRNRKDFLELMRIMFHSNHTTIEDLFLGNVARQDMELYIWDYHRVIRHFEFNLLFGMLCDFFDIKIFSHKQGYIEKKDSEKPTEKFTRYLLYSANAFSSEEYSWNISENVKKTVKSDHGITVSSKGNKWGSKFKDSAGNKVELPIDKIDAMNKQLKSLIHKQKEHNKTNHGKRKITYKYIIDVINKKFGVELSNAYITGIKNGKAN